MGEIHKMIFEIKRVRQLRNSFPFTNVLINPLRLLFKVEVGNFKQSDIDKILDKFNKDHFLP